MLFKHLIDLLNEHINILQQIDNPSIKFRTVRYTYVVNTIKRTYPANEKVTYEKIDKLGLTPHMREKIHSFINTTTKPTINKPTNLNLLSDNPLYKSLIKLIGLGPEKAKYFIDQGLKSIQQLQKRKWFVLLPKETQLFLKLKPTNKIQHLDIVKLEPLILALQTTSYKLVFVGSYRRKKNVSKDVDIMLVSKTPKALDKFLDKLRILVNEQLYIYAKGSEKVSLIVDCSTILNKPKSVFKIDIFQVNPSNAIPMLLYSTGSKEFNVYMRGQAKKQGYLLNQKGLFKDGKRVENLRTEKAYFNILNIQYRDPIDR